MACHVDIKQTGETYKNCVLDYGKPDDCRYAIDLHNEGKKREDCQYWKEQIHVCERCGHESKY